MIELYQPAYSVTCDADKPAHGRTILIQAESPEQAAILARAYGWIVEEDGKTFCRDCARKKGKES